MSDRTLHIELARHLTDGYLGGMFVAVVSGLYASLDDNQQTHNALTFTGGSWQNQVVFYNDHHLVYGMHDLDPNYGDNLRSLTRRLEEQGMNVSACAHNMNDKSQLSDPYYQSSETEGAAELCLSPDIAAELLKLYLEISYLDYATWINGMQAKFVELVTATNASA